MVPEDSGRPPSWIPWEEAWKPEAFEGLAGQSCLGVAFREETRDGKGLWCARKLAEAS